MCLLLEIAEVIRFLVERHVCSWEIHWWNVNWDRLWLNWSWSTIAAGTIWVMIVGGHSWDWSWSRNRAWSFLYRLRSCIASALLYILRRWNLVLDSSRLRLDWSFGLSSDNSELESELQLRLRSAVQLLENLCVVWVESDEVSGGIGVALKDNLGVVWNIQERAKLRNNSLACSGKLHGENI